MGIIEAITMPFVFRSLVGLLFTSLVASSVGPTLVARGITFLAEEVAHAALGGAALGILLASLYPQLHIDPLIFAFLFGGLSGVITAFVGEKGEIEKMESAIGVSLAMSMSLAVLFLGMISSELLPRVWGYLVGDILLLSDSDLTLLGLATIATVVPYMLFSREYAYIAFDIEGAEALGLNAKVYHYLSIITSALGVVVATKALGAILIYAFLIAPAATANELAKSFRGVSLLTLLLVIVSGVIGISSSLTLNLPPSGIIGLLTSTTYLGVVIYKRLSER